MGFDHADVGGELARQWKLPPLLEECIAYHHAIGKAHKHPRETALVHIANVIAQMAEIDSLDPADVAPIDPSAWEITGLDEDLVEPALRAIQTEVVEVEKLFINN
jgi:HD-like signal output (HDOD) protein